MNILVITHAVSGPWTGNRTTATRWASLLRECGHRVEVQAEYRGEEVDLSFWRAHLVRLGEAYYLDAQPVDFELAEAPSQQFYVMGLHALFRIEFKRARRSNCCRSTSGRSTKRSSKRKPITS